MVNDSAISSAHNALLGCFIPRVQAKRMKSKCLLYLILEQKSNASWVVQAIANSSLACIALGVNNTG